jgi:hypothetical protein
MFFIFYAIKAATAKTTTKPRVNGILAIIFPNLARK